MHVQTSKKDLPKVLSITLGLLFSSSSLLANEAISPEITSRENSLNIISNGLDTYPSARHDSLIKFSKRISTEDIVDWANVTEADVLSLEGTFQVGDQELTVMLGDLAGYDAPLETVINTQIENYHKLLLMK